MFNKLNDMLRANPKTIVFTEGPDHRILKATDLLLKDGLIGVILVGNVDEVKASAEKHGCCIEGAKIIDPATMTPGTDSEEWKKGIEDYMAFFEAGTTPEGAASMGGSDLLSMFVNGECAGMFAFSPFCLDVTKFLKDGEHEFTFKLYSGNRNMLGPHHRVAGEVHDVGPVTFTDRHDWCDDKSIPAWTDNYSFVEFGIKF